MSKKKKFYTPMIFEDNAEKGRLLVVPLGFAFPKRDSNLMADLLEEFDFLPPKFMGKYVIPVASSRKKLVELLLAWNKPVKAKLPPNRFLDGWICKGKSEWKPFRKQAVKVVRKRYGLKPLWIYERDEEKKFELLINYGNQISEKNINLVLGTVSIGKSAWDWYDRANAIWSMVRLIND